jgi:hypothetical protein
MTQSITELNQLSQIILKQAFDVHSALGPGLLKVPIKNV